ncbi:hypothetical protein L1987_32432 [Smallanthus sonchifolius]|uniref:Uncharacterized protein n=1 Tax=Smallanthus sonchifolius TaxID=185202 RepID=A0ACB9HN82_9ASTR|nr:hypothetical protein L1987_32432 [Smallanthus sonchifolius]
MDTTGLNLRLHSVDITKGIEFKKYVESLHEFSSSKESEEEDFKRSIEISREGHYEEVFESNKKTRNSAMMQTVSLNWRLI